MPKTVLATLQSLAVVLVVTGCASTYTIRSYPEGAKVKIQNVVSKEIFEIGESPATFEYDTKYGEGFIVKVEKERFQSEDVFLTKAAGANTKLQVNLKPMANDGTGDVAKADGQNDPKEDPQKGADDAKKKEEEQNLKERVAILEKALELYKDALFSPRLSGNPASYDRRRMDVQVNLVGRAQQYIEKRNFKEASNTIDKILEQDEYLAQGHVLKGTVAYLQGDYPGAIQSWERALEINPYEKITRSYLIQAYNKVGRQIPGNPDPTEIDQIERSPASSPLSPDPLKLRLRSR
jgi:tetratricopeptide (TPR) repeat protein